MNRYQIVEYDELGRILSSEYVELAVVRDLEKQAYYDNTKFNYLLGWKVRKEIILLSNTKDNRFLAFAVVIQVVA